MSDATPASDNSATPSPETAQSWADDLREGRMSQQDFDSKMETYQPPKAASDAPAVLGQKVREVLEVG